MFDKKGDEPDEGIQGVEALGSHQAGGVVLLGQGSAPRENIRSTSAKTKFHLRAWRTYKQYTGYQYWFAVSRAQESRIPVSGMAKYGIVGVFFSRGYYFYIS